jgi:hypothetical protein
VKAISRVLNFCDDAINPIAVKELRQAVQSRFVTVMLILFLLGQLVIVGWAVMFNEDITRSFEGGRGLFATLMGVLMLTCILFVPMYAGARLSHERSDTNVDLFFITTIRPGAIIRGKMLAAMVLALLIYGACMPFMTFTYLLRGLDIPSIFLTLGLGLLSTASAVMFSIFIAALPLGRFLRIVLGLILLIGLILLLSVTMSGSTGIVFFGAGSMADSKEFWSIAGTITALAISGIGFFYVLAVASLSPPSSNRTMPLRIYIPVIWLINGVVALLWAFHEKDGDPIDIWMVLTMILLCFSMLIAVSERDGLTRRIKRQIPQTRLLRPLAFLFFTGAAGGVLWCVVLMAATFLIAWLANVWLSIGSYYYGAFEEHIETMIVFFLYIFCYCMTALWIRRVVLPQVRNTVFTAVIALLLMIVGCIVPVLFAFFGNVSTRRLDDAGYWSMGNPFFVLDCHDDYRANCLALTVIWAAVVAAMNLPWMIKRYFEFAPPPATAPNPPEQP